MHTFFDVGCNVFTCQSHFNLRFVSVSVFLFSSKTSDVRLIIPVSGYRFSFPNFSFTHCYQQGVLGIKVKIMLDWDPKGKQGPTTPLPDLVTIHPPKDEEEYVKPAVLVAPEVPVA